MRYDLIEMDRTESKRRGERWKCQGKEGDLSDLINVLRDYATLFCRHVGPTLTNFFFFF